MDFGSYTLSVIDLVVLPAVTVTVWTQLAVLPATEIPVAVVVTDAQLPVEDEENWTGVPSAVALIGMLTDSPALTFAMFQAAAMIGVFAAGAEESPHAVSASAKRRAKVLLGIRGG